VGGPLKRYTVVSPSGVETVMKLNEADAKRYGVLESKGTSEPEAEPAAEPAPAKKRATSNKARTAADKDGGAGGGDD